MKAAGKKVGRYKQKHMPLRSKKELKNRVSFSRLQLIVVAIVFAAVGGYAIYRSFAAGPTTFGITAPGNTSDSLGADQKQVSNYTSTQAGKVSKITAYISGLGASSGTQNVKAMIYGDSSGTPGTLLGVSNAVTVNAGQAFGWVDFNFASPVTVPAGKVWMGFLGSTTSILTQVSANVVSGNNLIFAPNTGGYAAGPTNPFGGNQSTNGYQYVLYATYSASTAGDINNDGSVDGADLSIILANWGATSGMADLNTDNKVDVLDLSIVLSHFGTVVAPQPTVTISASPTSLASGSSSNLTWSSTNATSCTASGSWTGTKGTSGSGVSTGALSATSTFTITCSGAGGTSSPASATVTVTGGGGGSNSIYWGAYVEAAITYNHYFGGSWENSPWDIADTNSVTTNKFEGEAGKTMSIIHYGLPNPWAGSGFDAGVANLVTEHGAFPLVDMSTESTHLRDITAGMYDTQIRHWADGAKAWGKPYFQQWDVEMNGTWYGYSYPNNTNTAADFIPAWRHFHDVVVAEGATNVSWVWCPNIENPENPIPLSNFYPGDAYVDWTCIHGYNWGTAGGNVWQSFDQVFRQTYNDVVALAPSKPIMIGEIASDELGGSKANWITDALSTQLPQNYPKIRALVWFNWYINESGNNWNWPIESSSSSIASFKQAIGSSYYQPASPSYKNLPLLTKPPVP